MKKTHYNCLHISVWGWTMQLSAVDARGRVIAAARMLAGLDQQKLAAAAGVAGSTISNIEAGRFEARASTRRAIQRALKDRGVTITFDLANGNMAATMHFEPDVDL